MLRDVLHLGKFYPPHPGGIETHVRDLAVRQASELRVHVIVANSGRRSESCVMDGVSIDRVGRIATVASMPICPELPGAIRRCRARLVHLHTPNPGAALALLVSGHSGKLVITHHADTVGRRILRRLSDPFVHAVMERATRIIVTSARYLESSSELEPYRDKCCVVPLGINVPTQSAPDPESVANLRRQFGEKFIIAVGRLVPYKGFDVLIRAMKTVNATLVLIGTGPELNELHRCAVAEGVDGRVVMPGRVQDLHPYLAAASLFVLPSVTRAEAFGLVQLEAMAAGLPVVNTNIESGVPEVSLDGKTGFTVPPGDPGALAEAINVLLNRGELREQFGRAASARVHSEFTVDLMCERTLQVYEQVWNRG